MNYKQSYEAFARYQYQAWRMAVEIEELAICEVIAWRMYGIDAEFHYMQGELVVYVNV